MNDYLIVNIIKTTQPWRFLYPVIIRTVNYMNQSALVVSAGKHMSANHH